MEKERYLKYVKICERAERMKIDTGISISHMTIVVFKTI